MGLIYRHNRVYGNNPLLEAIGVGGGYAPVGTIIAYMGITAPQNYLACDGAVYNIIDYPQLTRLFELDFGSVNFFGGDGVTTFAVPDLRGEFLRGTGTNSHANQGSGANVGVHRDGTVIRRMGVHKTAMTFYGVQEPSYDWGTTSNSDASFPGSGSLKVLYSNLSDAGTTTTAFGFTTRPTCTSVLFCIKAVDEVKPTPDQKDTYSTMETLVGTWVDGSEVYRRCVNASTQFPPNTWTPSIISSSGIGRLIKLTVLDETNTFNCFQGVVGDSYIELYHSMPSSITSDFIIIDYTKS